MIRIICVGKIKEKFYIDAIEEYKKRLSKFTKLEIIEVSDDGLLDDAKQVKSETEKVCKYVNDSDYTIVMDILGKEVDSLEFASIIDNTLISNSNITFIIGGSLGLLEEFKKSCNKRISFGHITFPHQLFRVVLLEQIYRAFKILNNESYHK